MNLLNNGLCRSGRPQSENQRKREEQHVLGPCQRTKKKLWNLRLTVIPVVIGASLERSPKIHKGTERVGNRRTSRNHPNYRDVELGQNTEKNQGDLLSFRLW